MEKLLEILVYNFIILALEIRDRSVGNCLFNVEYKDTEEYVYCLALNYIRNNKDYNEYNSNKFMHDKFNILNILLKYNVNANIINNIPSLVTKCNYIASSVNTVHLDNFPDDFNNYTPTRSNPIERGSSCYINPVKISNNIYDIEYIIDDDESIFLPTEFIPDEPVNTDNVYDTAEIIEVPEYSNNTSMLDILRTIKNNLKNITKNEISCIINYIKYMCDNIIPIIPNTQYALC